VCRIKIRIQFQRALQRGNRQIVVFAQVVGKPHVRGDEPREGVELARPLHFADRLRKPSQSRQILCAPLVRRGVRRRELDRSRELGIRLRPVPVVLPGHQSQHSACFRKRGVVFQGLTGCVACRGKRLDRCAQRPVGQHRVGFCHPGVSLRVRGVLLDGRLEQRQRFLEIAGGHAVPEVARQQVVFVRGGIGRRKFLGAGGGLTKELRGQYGGHV